MKKLTKILSAAGAAVVLCTTAFSAGTLISINVDPSIKILVNGEEFKPTDVNGNEVMTFTYNGTTYAPLRALAEAYGLEVGYDAEKKMATVGYYSEDTYGAVTGKMDEALDRALYYLSIFNFSRHALSGQLAIDGYSAEEAEYAVDNCGADWYDEALSQAINMLDSENYSRATTIDILISSYGYTRDEAEYAADNCGADWAEIASNAANSYYSMGYEPDTLRKVLAEEGYTAEEIDYAIENIG